MVNSIIFFIAPPHPPPKKLFQPSADTLIRFRSTKTAYQNSSKARFRRKKRSSTNEIFKEISHDFLITTPVLY